MTITTVFLYAAALFGLLFILGLAFTVFTMASKGNTARAFFVSCSLGFVGVVFTCITVLNIIYKLYELGF